MATFDIVASERVMEGEEEQAAGAGRPPFEPTEEQRKLVTELATAGIRVTDIVLMIRWPDTDRPISVRTLQKCFARELHEGRIKASTRVAGSVFKAALAGNMTAAIFWLKTQAGWKETIHVEATGKDGAPLVQQHGVLVVPGVMDAAEWARVTAIEQAELMREADRHISGDVYSAEEAVVVQQ